MRLNVVGSGRTRVVTGLPVLDELLDLLAKTAGFDLELESHADQGEGQVEAVGAALGRALAEALERPGTWAIGGATAPSEEALAHVSLEASGRPLVVTNVDLTSAHLGGLRGDLLADLIDALARSAGLTVHVRLLHGEETRHIADAIVKALGLALAHACSTRRAQ